MKRTTIIILNKFKFSSMRTIYILLITTLFSHNVHAQKLEDYIGLNLQLNHYISKGKDKYFMPVNPSFEILYKKSLKDKVFLLSGINYSFSIWKHNATFSTKFRRLAHELSIPMLIEKPLGERTSITFGGYAGWLVKGKEENLNKNTTNWIDITSYTNYDESSKFTCDLYISTKIFSGSLISFSPFIKYKLTDNWMEEVRAKTYFGLNVKYMTGIKN